jgi:hypothetical protein
MLVRAAFVLITGTTLAIAGGTAPSLAKDPSPTVSELTASVDPSFRRYGSRVELGHGEARAYVELNTQGIAQEIGIALSEDALEGLPATGTGHAGGHQMPHTYLFDLPREYSAPFKFVEMNWNPAGHEPAGVYQDVPHFDFHFYTIERAEREAIVPTDPQWADKANRIPGDEFAPPFAFPLAPPQAPLSAVAVPMMGVHWIDVRSPELQGVLGKPDAYRPFTKTFIHGSWDGEWIFWEPMITRAYILAKKEAQDPAVRDELVPLPIPGQYQEAGRYPTAYRITWDEQAREYRIELTGLASR